MAKSITLSILLFLGFVLQGQIYYPTPPIPENPGNLNNDPESPVGQGLPASWSVVLGPNNASPTWSANQTMPFTFMFNGQSESAFKVSSSGVLTFEVNTALAAPGYTNATIPNAAIPNKSIMIWGIKGSGSNDNIVSKVFGTAPNRQLWIMFSSYSFAGASGMNYAYFSIVLEETTNHIYLVDQRHSGTMYLTPGVQVDAAVAYSIAGSPNVSALSGNGGDKGDNVHYAFYPGPQPSLDASCQQILLASAVNPNAAPFTLQAKFGNYGYSAITSATINYRINGGNTVSSNLTSLNMLPGTSTTLSHPTAWNPGVGTYTLEMWLTNLNGSADEKNNNDVLSKTIEVTASVGLDELVADHSFKAYPNPVQDMVYLDINATNPQNASIQVFDATGRVVLYNESHLTAGKNKVGLNLEQLQSGIYLISAQIDQEIRTLRICKL